MPALIQNYRNHVVETRLKKFYTIINQAIQMAESRYGDRKDWYMDVAGVDLDEDGNVIDGTSEIDNWFQKYFKDFMVIKKTIRTSGVVRYYLTDGSSFQLGTEDNVLSSRAVTFYPGNSDRCPDNGWGICKFYFLYMTTSTSEKAKYHYNKGVEPCKWEWDGTLEWLKQKCYNSKGKYCAALIQVNGWIIPKDYKYKVYY